MSLTTWRAQLCLYESHSVGIAVLGDSGQTSAGRFANSCKLVVAPTVHSSVNLNRRGQRYAMGLTQSWQGGHNEIIYRSQTARRDHSCNQCELLAAVESVSPCMRSRAVNRFESSKWESNGMNQFQPLIKSAIQVGSLEAPVP